MTGLVAILGGHEHQVGCEPFDRRLLAESGTRRPVVAVLLAATVRRRVRAKVAEATRYWRALRADVTFGFADAAADGEVALAALTAPDLVVLTGGRPWLLQRRLTAPVVRRLWQLHADGVPIAGSSAGAMALGATRLHLEPGHTPHLAPGLGFVAGAAAPHYGRHGTGPAARLLAHRHPRLPILGLPDRTALVGRAGVLDVMGVGGATLLHGRHRREHPAGCQLILPHAGLRAPPLPAMAPTAAAMPAASLPHG